MTRLLCFVSVTLVFCACTTPEDGDGQDDGPSTDIVTDDSDADTDMDMDPFDVDADGDGFTPNEHDCDDKDPDTFPGAAPNDSATFCMTDVDDDDYGDSRPGRGVAPGSDCLDTDVATYLGAPEQCDGQDQSCSQGIDDEINECWMAVYRFRSPSSETRCLNFSTNVAPSYCPSYGYELEAFVAARQPFDGALPIFDCHRGDGEPFWFDQIPTIDVARKNALVAAGYTCVELAAYAWPIGTGPRYNPFAQECPARSYYWSDAAVEREVGNGHLTTIYDSERDLTREGDAFTVVTDHTCF